MRLIILILSFSLSFVSCVQDQEIIDDPSSFEDCMDFFVEIFQESHSNESCIEASIGRYWFQNEIYWAFDGGNCSASQGIAVRTWFCQVPCTITNAQPECFGEHFFDNAELVKTVWTSE